MSVTRDDDNGEDTDAEELDKLAEEALNGEFVTFEEHAQRRD